MPNRHGRGIAGLPKLTSVAAAGNWQSLSQYGARVTISTLIGGTGTVAPISNCVPQSNQTANLRLNRLLLDGVSDHQSNAKLKFS
jgi:hypothetical protein